MAQKQSLLYKSDLIGKAARLARLSGPVSALESEGLSALENGDQVHEQVRGEGGGRVVAPGGEGGIGDGLVGDAEDVHKHDEDKLNEQVQGEGGRRVVAPGGDGGVGSGQGGNDQHHGGSEEVQGGRVQEEEGGEAEDVHHQPGGSLIIHTSSRPTFHTGAGRNPKPMYFKKKRGIISDWFVQMRLSNFRKQFPNLKVSFPTNNIPDIQVQNQSIYQYITRM